MKHSHLKDLELSEKQRKMRSKDMAAQGEKDTFEAVIYRSEVIEKNLKPVWKPFKLTTDECGGIDSELLVKVYDWSKNHSHTLIGIVRTSLRRLVDDASWAIMDYVHFNFIK